MGLKLITPPAVEPVDLERARAHLRLDASGSPPEHADDALVTAYLKAARQNLDGREGWLGRALCTQTWDLSLDGFEQDDDDGEIVLPLPPLQAVESITYVDSDGATQTVDPSLYAVDTGTEPGRVRPAYGESWPAARSQANAVTVRFRAGYTDGASPEDTAGAVPEAIKLAMLLTVGHWYEVREAVAVGDRATEMPMSAKYLLAPFRVWGA